MTKRIAALIAATSIIVADHLAHAQPAKLPRIGHVSAASASDDRSI